MKKFEPEFTNYFYDQVMLVPTEWANVEVPERLFHFTSAAGLLGIAQHHRIWATLSTSLNDVSERSYAENVALDVAKRGVTGVPRAFTRAIADLLRRGVDQTIGSVRLRVFAASFCDTVDASSQWLHYGQDGTGLAIAFRGRSLPGKHFLLMPVSYSERKHRQLIRLVIQRCSSFIHDGDGGPRPEEQELVYRSFAQFATLGIRAISPAIKAPAFASEREWRLVTYEMESTLGDGRHLRRAFRLHNGRIVPFVERIFSRRSPIVGIELGFSCPMGETDPSFKLLGLGGVSIQRSSVAIRP